MSDCENLTDERDLDEREPSADDDFSNNCVKCLLFPKFSYQAGWQKYTNLMSEIEYLRKCRAHVLAEYWAKLPGTMKGPPGSYPGWLLEVDNTQKGVHLAKDTRNLQILHCACLKTGSEKNIDLRDLSSHLIILNGFLCVTGKVVCTCGSSQCYRGPNKCISHSTDDTVEKGELYLPVDRGVEVLKTFEDPESPQTVSSLVIADGQHVTAWNWNMLYDVGYVGDALADLTAIDCLNMELDHRNFYKNSRAISRLIEAIREGAHPSAQYSRKPNFQEETQPCDEKELLGCDVPSPLQGALRHIKQARVFLKGRNYMDAKARLSKAIAFLTKSCEYLETNIIAQRMVALSCVDRLYCRIERDGQKVCGLRDALREFSFCLGFLDSKRLPFHVLHDLKQLLSSFISLVAIKTRRTHSQHSLRADVAKKMKDGEKLDIADGPALKKMGVAHNDGECPICSEEWDSVSKSVVLLPCLHAMCAECLKSWMGRCKTKSKELLSRACIVCQQQSLSKISSFCDIEYEPVDAEDSLFETILKVRCSLVINTLNLQSDSVKKQVAASDGGIKPFMPPVGLLKAIADPTTRGSAKYSTNFSDHSSSEELCDEIQNMVINNLDMELEGIQGGPGTGKSETIVNVILKRVPASELVLVTSVQNKAVESLAIKLQKRKVPFIVMGSDTNDKLGPTASRYILMEQIEHDVHVKECRARITKLQDQDKLQKGYRRKKCQLMSSLENAKSEARLFLLHSARVVLGTIGACQDLHRSWHRLWHHSMWPARSFKTIIVDEAGCIPEYRLPVLIALQPKKMLLIGDHKQLEPFSKLPLGSAPVSSVLERFANVLMDENETLPLLRTQYRMHPSVSRYVSKNFYGGMLKSDEAILMDRLRSSPLASPGPLPPGILWLDYDAEGAEARIGTSRVNQLEVQLTMSALLSVITLTRARNKGENILVITFYQAQRDAILGAVAQSELASKAYAEESLRVITVDAAQGSEADYVILSTVCCNRRKDVGFLQEPNRICVASSRAKYLLLVVGHSKTLASSKNDFLKDLIQAAGKRLKEMDQDMLRRLWREGFVRSRWRALTSRLLQRWQPAKAQVGLGLLLREDMEAFSGVDVIKDTAELGSAFQGPESDDFM